MAEMDENDNGVDVCYNVQAVVDGKHKLIVDCDVINNPADHGQLSEMSIRAKNIFEVDGLKALADKGYYNADDLKMRIPEHPDGDSGNIRTRNRRYPDTLPANLIVK